jgi:hypothetical protein
MRRDSKKLWSRENSNNKAGMMDESLFKDENVNDNDNFESAAMQLTPQLVCNFIYIIISSIIVRRLSL